MVDLNIQWTNADMLRMKADAESRGYARGKIDGYKSGVEDAAKRCAQRAQSHFETGALEKCAMYESAAFFIRSLLPPVKEG